MASTEATGAAKGGGLIGLAIVTVLALGLGAGLGMFLDAEPAAPVDAGSNDKPAKAEKAAPPSLPADAKLVAMTPIVVNLAEPRDTWIRIEASVLVEGVEVGADTLVTRLAEDFVAYLRTVTLAQLEGPSGFQNLREDLLDRATIRDREHIKDVIIHGMVVE